MMRQINVLEGYFFKLKVRDNFTATTLGVSKREVHSKLPTSILSTPPGHHIQDIFLERLRT